MAALKTQPNNLNVKSFIKSINDPGKQADCKTLLTLMEDITEKKSRMWGDSIVGFGQYLYKYQSGREGDWFVTGFSPRKQNLTIYIMPGFSQYDNLMKHLGKYTLGKSCLYTKKLEHLNMSYLEKLITRSVKDMQRMYECS